MSQCILVAGIGNIFSRTTVSASRLRSVWPIANYPKG